MLVLQIIWRPRGEPSRSRKCGLVANSKLRQPNHMLDASEIWRPHDEANRTQSLITANIIITLSDHIPLYVNLAPKIAELIVLGMSISVIAKTLKISRDTEIHALNYRT